MRIVCWNAQGSKGLGQESTYRRGKLDVPGLVYYLERWSADVAIFLEPPRWMRGTQGEVTILTEKKADERGSYETPWRLKGHMGGDSQGYVFVAYKDGGTGVEIKGGVPVPGAAQANHLVFLEATKGKETRRIATCHSPYAGNNGEASQYFLNAKKMLTEQTHFGVLAGSTDIWMGDLNTYSAPKLGSRTNLRTQHDPYQLKLAEPTSGFGKDGGTHAPLDKIFLKDGVIPIALGRIGPRTLDKPSALGAASGVKDILEDKWTDDKKVPSDHVPIYIDTTPIDTSPREDEPQPTASTSSDSSERKHPRDPMPEDPPDTRKKRKVVSDEGS